MGGYHAVALANWIRKENFTDLEWNFRLIMWPNCLINLITWLHNKIIFFVFPDITSPEPSRKQNRKFLLKKKLKQQFSRSITICRHGTFTTLTQAFQPGSNEDDCTWELAVLRPWLAFPSHITYSITVKIQKPSRFGFSSLLWFTAIYSVFL